MNWLSWRKSYYLFSLLLILMSAFFVLRGGIQPSIEFTGGATLRFDAVPRDAAQMESSVKEILSGEESHFSQDGNGIFVLDMQQKTNAQKDEIIQKIEDKTSSSVEEKSFQTVGPSVGQELIRKTFYAIAAAVFVILAYVWIQFRDWRFGLAAILAMLHDSAILIGGYAAFGYFFGAKADILFVTAILTVLSFSVHDTIVLFDQVRELRKTTSRMSFEEIGNLATTQTLSRSINNSVTILIMLFTLLILGGESLRWFTAALFVGTLVGTYSSTFVALPLVLELQKLRKR
jgi:preprotein translocase subunit SecF